MADKYICDFERENMGKVICISASNILSSHNQSISLMICKYISSILDEMNFSCEILDLRQFDLSPCIGCGKCFDEKRCCMDRGFNEIYDKLTEARCLFFVSPHYAPIPAKLCMLLEKMEQITFLHWWRDELYQSELYHIPVGIISHGGGSDWALKSYKAMVNDTIANALDTIQCKVVPYDEEWDTGVSLPVHVVEEDEGIFPVQKYDWDSIEKRIKHYVELVTRLSGKDDYE